jgi:tRNA-binding EMAP/Myf-like protein
MPLPLAGETPQNMPLGLELELAGESALAVPARVAAAHLGIDLDFTPCPASQIAGKGVFDSGLLLQTRFGPLDGPAAILRYICALDTGFSEPTEWHAAEIDQWCNFAQNELPLHRQDDGAPLTGPLTDALEALDDVLAPLTFIVGQSFSAADISLACAMLPLYKHGPSAHALSGRFVNVARHFLTCVHQACFQAVLGAKAVSALAAAITAGAAAGPSEDSGAPDWASKAVGQHWALDIAPAAFYWLLAGPEPTAPEAEGAKGSGAKAVHAGAHAKKQPKEQKGPSKAPTKRGGGPPPPKPAAPNLTDVSALEIRVGFINKAWKHPESEKLWCEEIDVGEEAGPRQIASGLQVCNYLAELCNYLLSRSPVAAHSATDRPGCVRPPRCLVWPLLRCPRAARALPPAALSPCCSNSSHWRRCSSAPAWSCAT